MIHTGMECLQRLLTYPPIENPTLIIEIAINLRSIYIYIYILDYIIGKYPDGNLSLPKNNKTSYPHNSPSLTISPRNRSNQVSTVILYINIIILDRQLPKN